MAVVAPASGRLWPGRLALAGGGGTAALRSGRQPHKHRLGLQLYTPDFLNALLNLIF
jgi:hypothetical protein